MKPISPQQIKLIHTLMSSHDKANKATIAESYSAGRTSHISELADHEARALIEDLKKRQDPDPGDKMRKKILSLAYKMNWTCDTPNGLRADIRRINDWCLKYGYLHKPLNSYQYRELPRLLTQFENLYKGYLKSI